MEDEGKEVIATVWVKGSECGVTLDQPAEKGDYFSIRMSKKTAQKAAALAAERDITLDVLVHTEIEKAMDESLKVSGQTVAHILYDQILRGGLKS